MSMMHVRVVCPESSADEVAKAMREQVGAVAVTSGTRSSDGTVITVDVARESVDSLLDTLTDLGVPDEGFISLEAVDTALGSLADKAEKAAPGEGADALIWEELASRTGEDSKLTGVFLAFMVLACILAAIGVVTDSSVTIVGAMVVGPEFGPLAAIALGLVRGRWLIARRAGVALLVGFPVAIGVVALLALAARAAGLFDAATLTRNHSEVDFVYSPGWFSLITALVAGCAGMLSLTSSKSSALVGVFISVTTIPAAGNVAVSAVVGDWHQTWQSLAVLAINLVGIVVAGYATLRVLHHAGRDRPDQGHRSGPAHRPVTARGA